jgi:hypothetical protein
MGARKLIDFDRIPCHFKSAGLQAGYECYLQQNKRL